MTKASMHFMIVLKNNDKVVNYIQRLFIQFL
jgi:hypothetical protein